MSIEAIRAKWDDIYGQASREKPIAADVLLQNLHLLPASGTALDLACGLGNNGLVLAEQGLQVTAWDISPVAIQQLRETATGLNLTAEVRDVESMPMPVNAFDVIVVSRFLTRALAPALIQALKPAGLLFYQTYTRAKLSPQGPSNPEYLLAENELLRLFQGLQLRYYREDGRTGDMNAGQRNEAYFVGQKVR